jgi:hypothetical protein
LRLAKLALDPTGKSARYSYRRNGTARAARWQRAIFIAAAPACKFGFDLPQSTCRFFVKFDSSGKSAAHCNHRMKFDEPAPATATGSFICGVGWRRACEHAILSRILRRRASLSEPSFNHIADARERVGKQRTATRTPAAPLAPEMIAPPPRSCRALLFAKEAKRMTAYLISLATMFLIAAVFDGVA